MSEPVGIIYPPPDLRTIVDRTATYVAKNGAAFEERIKREHRDKPKFSFLLGTDPFNAYYQHKVKEIRSSLLGSLDSKSTTAQSDESTNQPADDNQQQHQQQSQNEPKDNQSLRAQQNDTNDGVNHNEPSQPRFLPETVNFVDPPDFKRPRQSAANDPDGSPRGDEPPRVRLKLNEYIQEMTKKLEEPPPLCYLATSAPFITHMECDIIKLTAQFISIHGRSFLLELVSRELNNSQFDFLKPQHGQFSYMTNLIMQYALIRNQPLDIKEQLEKDATSQKHVYEKIKMRAEWTKMLELEKRRREEAEEKEKALYSEIDWHDFVLVETIDYQPDDRGEYPPTTADQVGTRLLVQQRLEEQTNAEEMEIDMDVDSDADD